MPNTTSSTTPAISPTGTLLFSTSGTREHTAPIATLITVMTDSAPTDPMKDTQRPSRMASRAAMKNVLSPISERKMREKAARKPLRPRGPSMSAACGV